ASEPAPTVASAAPQVTKAIAAVVDRALAFEKTERWADARAMAGALEEACARVYGTLRPGVTPRPETSGPLLPRAVRRARWRWRGGLGPAAVLGAGAVAPARARRSPAPHDGVAEAAPSAPSSSAPLAAAAESAPSASAPAPALAPAPAPVSRAQTS